MRSMRSTPMGEIARALKLHSGLLYTDERDNVGGKEETNMNSACCIPGGVATGGTETKKEIVLVQW